MIGKAPPSTGAPATRRAGPPEPASEQDYEAILLALVQAVLAALEPPHAASTVFIGQLLLALRTHLLARYGATQPGGLAPEHALRAKEYLLGSPLLQLSVPAAAALCGLSRGHFSRAFKLSTGQSPHQWATQQRLRQVLALLHSEQSMAEIATTCGFTDARRLSRSFRRAMGISPNAWRRQYP